jgi:uncharacterized repeat protein (TIGR03803 family)
MNKFSSLKIAGIVVVFCVATAVASPGQATFTSLLSFDGTNGFEPGYGVVPLTQGTDGQLYGVTAGGGSTSYAQGTVFKVTTGGNLTTLYNFCHSINGQGICADGRQPMAGLIQATNGEFYGTTRFGGDSTAFGCVAGCGAIFTMTAAGKLTTLHDFDGTDGFDSYSGPVQGTDGNFYGTTTYGGVSSLCPQEQGCGTVYKITPAGNLITLHEFDETDGYEAFAGLVQGTDGNFYGTTVGGGINDASCAAAPYGCGTIFKIDLKGFLTTLYQFCSLPNCADGEAPYGGLVQAADGNFYGTAADGGTDNYGTIFKITPEGQFTRLYRFFCSTGPVCPEGAFPFQLVQGTDGNFYGTTLEGGMGTGGRSPGCSPYCGTIFKITPEGTLTTLYNFCSLANCLDGGASWGLVQATDGNFYGTTFYGGTATLGTVYKISVGLRPFVQTNPTSGNVGTAVTILGNNLAAATSVTFNGTPATFQASGTYITTTVPSGATTGTVEVVTPKKTFKSKTRFRVP